MAGNDREPIGRKGKPTRPVKQKVSRRRYEDDDDYDDYDDEPKKSFKKSKKEDLDDFDEPDLKKSLLLTKNLLMSFVKINDEYIVKSKIYKEVTLESNYMLGSIDLGSDIIDLEKLKCVHRQMGIFYVNDYVRLTKVLNTLKRVRSNLNNENCITKS